MHAHGDETNPIIQPPGEVQSGVDPIRLRPSRSELSRARLEFQRGLQRQGQARFTMIQVSREGVIVDGHHGFRAAAEGGRTVDVRVSPLPVQGRAGSILDLPVT